MSGEVWDAPNQQVVRADQSAPWEEGTGGGDPGATPKARGGDERLPGQHAGLDELAAERGHEWSTDDLTVAEKRAELEAAGHA